jgi:hypothetical protein
LFIYLKVSQLIGYDAHRVGGENGKQGKHSVNDGRFFDADAKRFHVDGHVRQQNSDTFREKRTGKLTYFSALSTRC